MLETKCVSDKFGMFDEEEGAVTVVDLEVGITVEREEGAAAGSLEIAAGVELLPAVEMPAAPRFPTSRPCRAELQNIFSLFCFLRFSLLFDHTCLGHKDGTFCRKTVTS